MYLAIFINRFGRSKPIYYAVYEVRNNINGRIYIGVHKTKNLDDGYLGSGSIMKTAVKKYGRAAFTKRILFVYDNAPDMYAKERELVTEEFVARPDTYNMALGGMGGQTAEMIRKAGEKRRGQKRSEETKAKMRAASAKRWAQYEHTEEKAKERSRLSTKFEWRIKNMETGETLQVRINQWCRDTGVNLSALKYAFTHRTTYRGWGLEAKVPV